jgi:hypothetical protein
VLLANEVPKSHNCLALTIGSRNVLIKTNAWQQAVLTTTALTGPGGVV